MELLRADRILRSQKRIVIKPNLINTSPPPITTSVKLVAAIVEYIKAVSDAETIVAKGCGASLRNVQRICFCQCREKSRSILYFSDWRI